MTLGVRIGEAAATLGVDTHVLRHWEDMGLLRPPRSSSGHRVYDEELVTRARLIQVCQRAGMSLAQIRELGAASPGQRVDLVIAKQAEIREVVDRLLLADAFLEHLLACRHPIVSECAQCTGFAAAHQGPGRPLDAARASL